MFKIYFISRISCISILDLSNNKLINKYDVPKKLNRRYKLLSYIFVLCPQKSLVNQGFFHCLQFKKIRVRRFKPLQLVLKEQLIVCHNKTRTKVREDTVLINFPLYRPLCKNTTLVNDVHLINRLNVPCNSYKQIHIVKDASSAMWIVYIKFYLCCFLILWESSAVLCSYILTRNANGKCVERSENVVAATITKDHCFADFCSK